MVFGGRDTLVAWHGVVGHILMGVVVASSLQMPRVIVWMIM